VKLRMLSLSAALCLSITMARPSVAQVQELKPEPPLLRQMLQEGWTKVAEGVLQRGVGMSPVETFGGGEQLDNCEISYGAPSVVINSSLVTVSKNFKPLKEFPPTLPGPQAGKGVPVIPRHVSQDDTLPGRSVEKYFVPYLRIGKDIAQGRPTF
jgi:hypothetical protein